MRERARFCSNCEGSGFDERDLPCRCQATVPPPKAKKVCRRCLNSRRLGEDFCTCVTIAGLTGLIEKLPDCPLRSERQKLLTYMRTKHAQAVLGLLRV